MGLYDSLYVSCPKCGVSLEFQTKVGPCMLKTYTLNDCPPEIAGALDGEKIRCHKCDKTIKVVAKIAIKMEALIED